VQVHDAIAKEYPGLKGELAITGRGALLYQQLISHGHLPVRLAALP